jgi:hypothetical protein
MKKKAESLPFCHKLRCIEGEKERSLVFLLVFNAVPFASSADVTSSYFSNRVDLDAFTSMSWFLFST